jgi:hypothetical protein
MIHNFFGCLSLLLITLILTSGISTDDNGASIYNTGRNLQGFTVLDREASRIRIVKSCKGCHGPDGDRMRKRSIRFRDLSDSTKMRIPYTDSLFFRFLEADLRSDGSKANIGVIWKMSRQDEEDLLAYLKKL